MSNARAGRRRRSARRDVAAIDSIALRSTPQRREVLGDQRRRAAILLDERRRAPRRG